MNSYIDKYFHFDALPYELNNINENYILILSSCIEGEFSSMSVDNANIYNECIKFSTHLNSPFQVKNEKDSIQPETYAIYNLIGIEKKLIVLYTNIYCTNSSFGDDTTNERCLRFRRLLDKLLSEHKEIKSFAMSYNFTNVEPHYKQMYCVFLKDEIIKRKIASKLLKITFYNANDYLSSQSISTNSTTSSIVDTSTVYVPKIINSSKPITSNCIYIYDTYSDMPDGVDGKYNSELNPTWKHDIIELEIPYSWKNIFDMPIIESKLMQVSNFVKSDFEKIGNDIQFLPEQHNIFKAFELCSFNDARVVIIGQDPYPNVSHAMGLAFSVKPDVNPIPGSLKNIYKALGNDPKIPDFVAPTHGDLTSWAKQGVLMINTALTYRLCKGSNAHISKWQEFTDEFLKEFSKVKSNVVFIMWGGPAQKKATLIDETKHLVLKYIHPSPRNGDKFYHCPNFSETNDYLIANGLPSIDWCLN